MAKKHEKVMEHLASLLKDISFAAFGLFGYSAVDKMVKGTPLTIPDVSLAVLGAVIFLVFNAVALLLLKDD